MPKDGTISEIVNDPEWQRLRASLVGTWKDNLAENVKTLRGYLGDMKDGDKLKRILNYLTGSAFRSGTIKGKPINDLLAEVKEALATMEIEKLKIPEINTESLKEESDSELLNLHRHLHGLWAIKRKTPSAVAGVSLEDIWNTHTMVANEMENRKMVHGSPLSGAKLPQKKSVNIKQEDSSDDLAPVKPSGNEQGPEISLEDVLQHIKSFKIRQPLIYLTGGIVNNGKTVSDIDFQVKGDVSPAMLKIIQFRLGRMLPKELSARVSLMTDEFDGPFTNNIPLGDLMFKVNDQFQVLRMRDLDTYEEGDFIESEDELFDLDIYTDISLMKQDPLMFYPKKEGKRPAVIQLHFRGKSTHGDFRFDIGDELIGWTAFWQLAGKLKDINTVEEGRKVISGFTMADGNEFLKPILAPKGLQFTPKKPEPKDWIAVEGTVDPGEVGATAEQEGVFIILENPKDLRVEWGMQKSHFHEYFLTNGKHINGTLFLRLLSSRGTERAGGSPTYWRGFISKSYLPSVIHKRAVETGDMPPDGISAMPVSLMAQTPKEFKYWEHAGKKAKEVRDALVESKFFTEENIQLVKGEYKRVEVKKSDDIIEIYAPICKVDKEARMVYGIVLEPNVVDAQGDIVSEDEITKACHYFMEETQKIGYQHEDFKKKFRIMECYIAPGDFNFHGQDVRKGTWLLAVRVLDDDVWKEVKKGEITGFSIGGVGTRERRS